MLEAVVAVLVGLLKFSIASSTLLGCILMVSYAIHSVIELCQEKCE